MNNIKKQINHILSEIEKEKHVKILYAAESGSRAWGVESPDSDYDVRFIYVQPMENYLSIHEQKDIIEWQLDDILDINGWDLKKTLQQFRKGNATLFEWANSPIVYKTTAEWKEIYENSKHYFSEKAALYHYYGTANSTFRQYLQKNDVKYKKYIYALRPLLACKYIENNHAVPPVKFQDLLKQPLSPNLSGEIERMLAIKAKSGEKDTNPQISVIQAYIENELIRYEQISKDASDDRTPDWTTLDKIFIKILKGQSDKSRN